MAKSQKTTKITFSQCDIKNHCAVEQVYGMEFRYNNQSIAIKNFALNCLYLLSSRCRSIFNINDIDDDDNFAEICKLNVELNLGRDPHHITLQDYCFYNVVDCMTTSQAYKYMLILFAWAQYFHHNPVCTNDHLIKWIEIFLKTYFYRDDGYGYSINPTNSILNFLDQISKNSNAEEIFHKLYNIANHYCAKVNVASLSILEDSNQNIDFSQIQTHMIVKQVQLSTVGSYQLDDVLAQPNIFKTVQDSNLIRFLKTTPSSFKHVYKLNNLTDREFADVKTQIASSMDRTNFRITKHYIAGTTDEIHLILKLLVPTKFESMADVLMLMRTFIR